MEGKTPLDAVLTYQSGPNISTARNKIVDDFLTRQHAPWLLMVDTDMVFAADALDRLVYAADPVNRPLLGGLCFSQNGDDEPYPVMYELGPGEAGSLAFTRYTSWPEDSCQRVSATGAAFLLMHRDALARIETDRKSVV